MKELLFLFTKVMALTAVPPCLVLAVFARDVILLWVGDAFTAAAPVMSLGLASLALTSPFAACEGFPNAYGRMKWPAIFCVVFSAASVAASYYLGVTARLALTGIAAASGAASVLYAAVFTVPYACRLASLRVSEFCLEAYIRPVVFAAGVWGGFSLSLRFSAWPPVSPASAVLALAFLVFYAVGSYFWVLNKSERSRLIGLWKDLSSRPASARS